jgi:hypothetical protein
MQNKNIRSKKTTPEIALLILLALSITVFLLQAISGLQRCDDLGSGYIRPSPEHPYGVVYTPSGRHCFRIWQKGFWIKPGYL